MRGRALIILHPMSGAGPHLDNELCEGLCDDLEKVRGITATTDVEGGDHESSDMVQVARGSLKGQQDQNGQPVKAVVHCGPCEGPGQGGYVAGQPGAWVCKCWGSGHAGLSAPHRHHEYKPPPYYPPPHRRKSVLSPACIKATMVLVTEVPMLEPMMMGIAELTSSTGGIRNLLTNWVRPPSFTPTGAPARPMTHVPGPDSFSAIVLIAKTEGHRSTGAHVVYSQCGSCTRVTRGEWVHV